MENTPPTFWLTGWLPNGFKVSFTIPTNEDGAKAYEQALSFSNALLASGLLLTQPGLEAGEEKELITTVMRRAKESDGTPIIDFYPQWGEGGDIPYGTFRSVGKYLNGDEQIAKFLQASGLKSLEAIPLYDGQAPLRRTAGKLHPKETPVPTPFYIVVKRGEEKSDSAGKPYRPKEVVRYEPVNSASNRQADGIGAPYDKEWNPELVRALCDKYGTELVKTRLGIKERWTEWWGSYADAVARIETTTEDIAF